ncbi:putative DNA primase/helicase [Enterococcus sp. PF1-24]|uniref:DNA primase family protein n=1 Tax=unclassified Enterococcus TaxID=2608891 RepID=UPI002476B922|nr:MULTISPECIES: DUF5906 domain-containing protein [unclassified Enterococcus]MDH6363273.1 putative DNA primase/helicase [Enterococcus sp. PFB1-1]MDH6400426.1 putative DNA primase/helicase [Enterococcus sp. PF1-24]
MNELEELRELQAKNTIKPFHINVAIAELKAKLNSMTDKEAAIQLRDEKVEELQNTTPPWFWIVSGKELDIIHGFNHEEMGDSIIHDFNLVRYPTLLEGAVYDPKRGAWRYFGKNEMISFSENQTLVTLQKWGYYEQKFIGSVSRYIKQKTYDPNYPILTPFEESRPELVVFKNGTYNILTGELRKNAPNDYILMAFDYEIDISGRETPATDKLFSGFLGESDLFMKQFIGYMFYRSHAPAQDMLFFYGEGGEGKSSFLKLIIENYITKQNSSAVTPYELATDKFSVVSLLGKAANINGDLEKAYIENSGILKRLTGGDRLKAEYKGIQSFTFENHAKQLFSLNEFFHFNDLSQGFADRLNVIPITVGNQRDNDAPFWKQQDIKAIEKEAPAFVYKCICEFRKIFNGTKATFTKSAIMEEAKCAWLFDNDRIGQFLFEATELHKGDDRGEIAATVYKELKTFLQINGFKTRSAQELTKYLDKKGHPKRKCRKGYNDGGSSQWRYIGVELKLTFCHEEYP